MQAQLDRFSSTAAGGIQSRRKIFSAGLPRWHGARVIGHRDARGEHRTLALESVEQMEIALPGNVFDPRTQPLGRLRSEAQLELVHIESAVTANLRRFHVR